MKKKVLFFAALFGMAVAANAQLTVGGLLNFSGHTKEVTEVKSIGIEDNIEPANFQFTLSPQVGYILKERWEVGGRLNLSYQEDVYYIALYDNKGMNGKAEKDTKSMYFEWSIEPYARFRCFEKSGFGIWMEASVKLGTAINPATKYYAYGNENTYSAGYYDEGEGVFYPGSVEYRTQETADLWNKENNSQYTKYVDFNGGLYFRPVFTYTIQDHFRLEMGLDAIGFALRGNVYEYTVKNNDDTEENYKRNSFYYDFGLQRNNLLTVGFSYVF